MISQQFRKTQYKNSFEGKEISMRSKNTSGAHTRYSTQYYWALTLWVLGKFSHIQRDQYETFEDDDGKRSNVELTFRVRTIKKFQAKYCTLSEPQYEWRK